MPKRPVVGVVGHYGNRNLGDEAIVTATIQQLRNRLTDAEIVCFSLRPSDTAYRHNVECFSVCYLPHITGAAKPSNTEPPGLPWRRGEALRPEPSSVGGGNGGLKRKIKGLPVLGSAARAAARWTAAAARWAHELRFTLTAAKRLRRFDLLVVAGSNQFLDNFGGTWDFPFTLLRWSVLARLTGTRIAYVSVGAGPLDGRLSKLFIRLAIRLADYVSYRDVPSKNLVENGWPRVDSSVYPDLAFGLDYQVRRRPSSGVPHKPVVAINPMPVFDHRYWFEHDESRYRDYVGTLAALAARMIEGEYPIFFFPTMWRDDDVIRDVIETMRTRHGLDVDTDRHFRPNEEVSQLIGVLQEADIVVATRFHGVVLSYHLGLPVLGIGYFRKTFALMQEMGQASYHRELGDCDVDDLWNRFLALEASLGDERKKIVDKSAEYRRLVGEQWDTVAKLAAPRQAQLLEQRGT